MSEPGKPSKVNDVSNLDSIIKSEKLLNQKKGETGT